jgi:hypothetical protein
MAPTDSIEKPPTVERTAGPIAVFSNSYARLPEHFFARLAPTPVPKPRLIKFNEALASELGVDAQGFESDELAAVFAGNVTPPGAAPIAMAPMPGINSAVSFLSLATAAQSSSARSWTATASGAMSN